VTSKPFHSLSEYFPSTRRGLWGSLLAAALAGLVILAVVLGANQRLQA